jgi:cation transport regulator ChaB
MPIDKDMPSTLKRSQPKARRTYAKAHDSAVEEYGEGERAHRVAWGAVKHTYEKVGDHWEPKRHKGPSDRRSADPKARYRSGGSPTGGVDVLGRTKAELMDRARKLDIRGRSSMTKEQLAEAIKRRNDRATARARASE